MNQENPEEIEELENENANQQALLGWIEPERLMKRLPVLLVVGAMVTACLYYAIASQSANSSMKQELMRLKAKEEEYRKRDHMIAVQKKQQGDTVKNEGVDFETSLGAISNQINEQIANNMAALGQFEKEMNSVESLQSECESLRQKLSDDFSKLEVSGDPQGRKLASSEEMMSQYSGLKLKTSKAFDLPVGIDEFVQQMRKVVSYAKLNPNDLYEVKAATKSQLVGFQTDLISRRNEMQKLSSALSHLREKSAQLVPSKKDLLSSINDWEGKRQVKLALELAEIKRKALEKQKRDHAQKLLEEELLLGKAEHDQQLAKQRSKRLKIEQETARIKGDTDLAIAAKKAAEKLRQLRNEYEADMPDIRSYLSPFLANGRKLRESGTGPVSLSLIKSHGALAETDHGFTWMLKLGGDQSDEFHRGINDRPRGGFPRFPGMSWKHIRNPPLDYILRVQELIKKYGKIMVEDGLLAE